MRQTGNALQEVCVRVVCANNDDLFVLFVFLFFDFLSVCFWPGRLCPRPCPCPCPCPFLFVVALEPVFPCPCPWPCLFLRCLCPCPYLCPCPCPAVLGPWRSCPCPCPCPCPILLFSAWEIVSVNVYFYLRFLSLEVCIRVGLRFRICL